MANSKSLINFLGTTTYQGISAINIWDRVRTSQNDKIAFYDEYIVLDGDRWDSISYKFYQTPHLWWLIANYNKVKDPFTTLEAGTKIKIIKKQLITNIIQKLKGLAV